MSRRLTKKIRVEIEKNKHLAVGYRRVSDEKQRAGASLDTQSRAIEKYCTDTGLTLVHIYEDKCISGLEYEKREGFLEMIKAVRPGMTVVAFEVSRLGRDASDNLNLWKELQDKGCNLACPGQGIDSRTEGSEMIYGIQSVLAREESNKISKRVKANMNRLSSEGKLLCRPAFGYKQDKETRTYVRDEEQQAVIEMMRAWHALGVSYNEIARRLNEGGHGKTLNNNKKKPVPTPRFYPSTVKAVLINYGFIPDASSGTGGRVVFTYPQRVEKWNALPHEKKKEHLVETGSC